MGTLPGVFTQSSTGEPGTLDMTGGVSTPGPVTGLSVHAVDTAGNTADAPFPDFVVSDAAAGNALAFTTTNNQADMAIGDTGSASFAVSGGAGYGTPLIQYGVTGAPAGMSMTRADVSQGSTLAGQPRATGTFSPVVTASDGYTTVSYAMAPFNVTRTGSGLCMAKGWTSGTLPPGVLSDPRIQGEYAVVGCGTGPYTAVVKSGASDGLKVGQSPCSGGQCDGIITAAGTANGMVATVYDSTGESLDLSVVSFVQAPNPWDPLAAFCLWDEQTGQCHAP